MGKHYKSSTFGNSTNEFIGVAPLAKYMQSLPQNLKSWQDTFFCLRNDSCTDIYRETYSNDKIEANDSMTFALSSFDILQRLTTQDRLSDLRHCRDQMDQNECKPQMEAASDAPTASQKESW